MTTGATYNRTVTVDLPDYASQTITFRLRSSVAIAAGVGEIFPGKEYALTLDVNGVGSTALPCPDNTGDAAWLWQAILPDNEAPLFSLAYAGSSISLATLLATAASEATADEVADLISGKQDKDNDAVNDNIGIFADGQTVDSGFSIGDLGGTPTADSVTFDPAGNIAATDVQAAIEELDSEKSGTGHTHSYLANIVEDTTPQLGGNLDLNSNVITGLEIGTNVQAYDADLDAIAGLSPSNDDIIQRKAGAWSNRTMAQLKTDLAIQQTIIIACSDETTPLTAGAAKATFRMPYAMTLADVRASVKTAPTGSGIIVNIKEAGTTIFSTKSTIAAGAKTSVGGTPAVISDSALADDAEMTVDIDQVGSTIAGAGLKMVLIGTKV